MTNKMPNRNMMALILGVSFALITILGGTLALLKQDPYADADVPAVSEEIESQESSQESAPDEEEDTDQSEEQSESQESSEESQEEESQEDASEEDEEKALEEDLPEEDTSEEESQQDQPIFYNVPDQMRGVVIAAGRDFLTTSDTTGPTVAAQLDAAIAKAEELTMNSVIIDTKYNDQVLFDSDLLPMAQVDLDCVDYLVTKARESGLYVYTTYDVSDLMDAGGNPQRAVSADGETLDQIAQAVGDFAEQYEVDGILLQNYDNPSSAAAYSAYKQYGGGMGYERYLKQVPTALVETAAAAVRQRAPGTQVGLVVSAVWENQSADTDGSDTSASYTSLGTGNADTKAMVESGDFDFVMVENFDSTTDPLAPFRTVASWWKQVADEAGVTLYTMHANERLGVESYGWQVMEQLTKQVIDLGDLEVGSGSVFHSLAALAQDVGGTTTTLVQYMNDEIDETYVLQQLSISKPAQLTYTTKEPNVTFQGASDPREKVTMNGEEIPRNESGYFTITEDLKEGLNTFTFAHKNKTFTYNITREIIVLKEVQPTGKISVDGDTTVTITALAYQNSTVVASIGGQQVTLNPSSVEDDSVDRESGYQLYTGVFTAPTASQTATSLGTIKVTATMSDGHSMTLEGASVTVNKKAEMGDGVVVHVTADQAETFPVSTLNDNSDPNYFPLPKGTVDRAYGSEIVYKNGTKTYTYWKLQSGVRVYSKDITTGGQMPDNNEISSMSIKSSGQFTDVTLNTGSKIPYTVSYNGSKLVFKFQYTAKTPGDCDDSNSLFKSATWSGSNMTLTLKRSGGFMGYKAYYDDNNRLVLRFNNSPGSLSGARVVVDPGHGGNDPGALGFYPGKDEADINLAVSQKLVSELKSQGASVLMLTPGSTMASRLAAARAFNPHVLVSVHSNTNAKSSPKGTEVYYFYSFQKQLAANISANVASALGTENRGAKSGLYYMTRESQFPCVLAELGFISNEEEYTKLINSKYQTKIASGIASAINSYLAGVGAGYVPDEDDEDEEEESEAEEEEEADQEEAEISLNKTSINLKTGETYALEAQAPEDEDIYWEAEDESVATVNSSGKVTAQGPGTTYVIASLSNGASAECEVNVDGGSGSQEVTGVSLNYEELELGVDDTFVLKATVKPSSASNKKVNWESDDTEVAKVNSSGKVTAIAEGETTITVTTEDGEYTAECEVTVGKRDNSGGLVQKIVITGENTLEVDTRITLEAEVTPYNAEDPGVKWTTSDKDVVNLTPVYKSNGEKDEQKIKVEGLQDGTVTITAAAYDESGVKDTFEIKVGTGKKKEDDDDDEEEDEEVEHQDGVLVESIEIDGPSTIKKGTREVFEAKVTPNYAEDTGVKWKATDDEILEIYPTDDENVVKVEGLKKGSCYLVATAYDDGKAEKRIKITVTSD